MILDHLVRFAHESSSSSLACFFLLFGLLSAPSPLVAELPAGLQQNAPNTNTEAVRALRHQDPQWESVKLHLPDPATATEEQLETVADVLRARRFPEDALGLLSLRIATWRQQRHAAEQDRCDTARASAHGGGRVLTSSARFSCRRKIRWRGTISVRLSIWMGDFRALSLIYSRAIKLDKRSAIYHSNLATALFEEKRYKDARAQFKIALQLDPEVAHHDGTGGLTAHMLSPEDHARYCFEMARLYAELGDETNMLHFLTIASEGGFDVLGEMRSDTTLDRYRQRYARSSAGSECKGAAERASLHRRYTQ